MEPQFCGREAGVETVNQCMEHNQIVEEMLRRNINWKFNPPASSNHGGFEERLIRSEASVKEYFERSNCVN